jgi:serine phosphatase RsbU (regulator of sigma subunit)
VMVVGDVMGRGVAAAAAMAQVRASVRAYVAIDPSPALVLDRLSILFETVEVPQLVTVLYAVVDPVAGTVDVLSAGHLPAFVVRPGGEVDQLDVESSPPLGAGVFVRGVGRFAVGRGDVLLMVTDGLVERRGEDIDAGMARLAGEAAGLAQDVSDDRLTQIADVLREQGHDDDVTLLAVRRSQGWDQQANEGRSTGGP